MTVETRTPDEACQLAIASANEGENWRMLDAVGDTFVEAIRLGKHDDAWYGSDQIAVPERFTESALFAGTDRTD